MSGHPSDIKTLIADRIRATPDAVWTAVDFLDLGSREAVDKTLQRLDSRILYPTPGSRALRSAAAQ